MGHPWMRGIATFGAAAVTFAVATSASAIGPFGLNLVVNGDAEGSAGATSATAVAAPIGWETTGGFSAVVYGTPGFPSSATPGPQNRGQNFFAGGPTGQLNSAAQTITLSDGFGVIDSGTALYNISAWLGGNGSQDDVMIVSVTFNDALGDSLSTVTLNGPTSAQRNLQTLLLLRSRSGTVPVGTRSINVAMIANRASGAGTYNDGYADEISVRLINPCVADVTIDGGVGIEDLLLYLQLYDLGELAADVDDGTGTGSPDGGVSIDDLLYYLARYDAGC